MPHGRRTLFAGIGVLWGICATGAGCEHLGLTESGDAALVAAAEAPGAVIAPRTVLAWSVEAEGNQPTHVLAGKDVVGPDGSVVVGPYGSVHVAGLSVAAAQTALERHLAAYLRNPRVHLRPVEAAAEAVAESREPARRAHLPTLVAVAGWQALTGDPAAVAPPAAPAASAEWHPVPPGGDSRGKTVIASNWRPAERGVVSPVQATAVPQPGISPLVAAELPAPPTTPPVPPLPSVPAVITAPEAVGTQKTDDKKGDDKRADEKSPALTPEQLPSPSIVPGQDAPSVPGAPPAAALLGMPVATPGPGGPAPRELCKVSLPPYVVEPPDVLLIESTQGLPDQRIGGPHLVRPDGTVGLGIYGSAHVAGMTLEQAKATVARVLAPRIKDFDVNNLNVDVYAFNSKFYYIITDGGGYGQGVYRLPVYGSETVLDAISQINGLPAVASKRHIWLARRQPGHSNGVLPVDWIGITQYGSTATNYQVLPGDRIYVQSDKLIRIDTGIAKVVSPIERVLGAILLGSSTVNSLKGNNNNGTSR